MKMTGNTILVTGGTSGIGRALAEAFHDRGNRVIVTGRRQTLLDQITAERPDVIGLPLDLEDPASLPRLSAEMRERFPELNVLIANAGISRAEDMTAENWGTADAEAIVETNILGVLRATAAFLPILKSQPSATIIAAFLHSWLQSLRHQLRKIPIEVLELAPPYVQTELTGAQQASDARAMPLPAYATEVMQLLELRVHPRDEVLVERDRARRWAERDGRYEATFALMNPS